MTLVFRRPAVLRILGPLLLGVALAASAAESPQELIVRASLQQAATAFPVARRGLWRTSLQQIYERRAYAPLWFIGGRLGPSGSALLLELKAAEKRGLRAQAYWPEALTQWQQDPGSTPAEAARRLLAADVALSAVAARFAMDLHAGRVDPRRLGLDLDVPQSHADVGTIVSGLADASSMPAALDALEPRLLQYRSLKDALARYRLFSRDTSLARLPVPPKRSVGSGDSYAGSAALRALLRALGDLPAPASPTVEEEPPALIDAALSQALIRFQARHGLETDGVLGPATFRELTVPLASRVSQIELSLERARWLPEFHSPPIIVNIPQFRLFALRSTSDLPAGILRMDVVVGETFPRTRTPVFAAELRYVVLRPFWDVPRSILLRELLPQIRRDPAWIDRSGYEIVRGDSDAAAVMASTQANVDLLAAGQLRLRQKPGPGNALGQVKFMLPNSHNVYLHDTPAKALFSRARRAFSHGCIRVADPVALLTYVLREDAQRVQAALETMQQTGPPVRIALSNPIPVFILYGTALVGGSGEVMFFEDIYGLDAGLEAAMASAT